MKNVGPIRKELAVKLLYVGPMVNPSSPQNQLVGVLIWNSLEYMPIYQNTDVNVTILHSLDGYDEVSLTGPTKIITSSMEGAKSSGFWRKSLVTK
jgi:anthranilate phosphoribosyltransferase